MSYIDGFIIPVATADKARYLDAAVKFRDVAKRLGAIRQVECWGDDVPAGKQTDFRRSVDLKDGETVVFSWIEWPSKEVRDAGQKAMMADPAMEGFDMPFDGKRMVIGGFQPIFDSAVD